MRTLAEWIAEEWFTTGGFCILCGCALSMLSWITPESRKEMIGFWASVLHAYNTPELTRMQQELQKERANKQ